MIQFQTVVDLLKSGPLFGTIKLLLDSQPAKQTRLREEYAFAKEFLQDISEQSLHPYLVEKGFKTLGGSDQLDASAIAYLMKLNSPFDAIDNYANGHKFLRMSQVRQEANVCFRPKYESRRYRLTYKWMRLIAHLFMATLSVAPIIFVRHIWLDARLISMMAFWPFVLWGAYSNLKALERLNCAERVIYFQVGHINQAPSLGRKLQQLFRLNVQRLKRMFTR